MPPQRRYYGLNHAHFLTASTYRRTRLFDSDVFRLHFIRTLGELRGQLRFRLMGYVLMPVHCHLLIWPSEVADRSQIVQKLSERTANFVLRTLRCNDALPWCRRMLAALKLPPSVHHHAHCRVWQRGGYDLNIWSERKRTGKLKYMHANPAKRGLVRHPADRPWPSWRFYRLDDASLLAMDKEP